MFIFLGAYQLIAIPESQIINIQASGKKIKINYTFGFPEKEDCTFEIEYDSEESANAEMLDFFKACQRGDNAFHFGSWEV